jgi:hypothetical protein
MDSHYDQVMQKRAATSTGTTRLYFGYSTVLDRVAFDEWRSQHGYSFFQLPQGRLAEAVGVHLVYDFPSRFWGGRVAGLAKREGSSVFGHVFEISERDWPIIQHKEGAVTGMCVEWEVTVRVGSESLKAMAFTTKPERSSADGPVSLRFVEALMRGAQSAGLPTDYLQSLEATAQVQK